MKKLEHETRLIRLCCKVFCPIGLGHTYNNRLPLYLSYTYLWVKSCKCLYKFT